MFKYNYYRAETILDVCKQLATYKEKARIIAGGTDLMVQIREQDKKWLGLECLIDITALEQELRYIKEEENNIHIGALATHTDIEESELIRTYLPFLGAASATVGSPQIRNRGTIGGSICNASPAADPLTPLVAADTRVVIQGLEKIREVKLPEFYLGKGKIDLKDGEFVREFIVQKLSKNVRTEFVKLGRRKALAISRLNVAVALVFDHQGIISEARIAPGCIFVKPDRVTKAEEVVIGKRPSEEVFQAAGKAVSEVMIERTGIRWSTEYKQPAVEGIVEDALCKAAGMEA